MHGLPPFFNSTGSHRTKKNTVAMEGYRHYPIMAYTPYSIPFKRHRTSEIAWPRQPRETVFSTVKLLAIISSYASARPLIHALTVSSRVCTPLPRQLLKISNLLGAWLPEPAVALFLEKDKRGLVPWLELAKCTGIIVCPAAAATLDALLSTGLDEDRWFLAQTLENQRVLVRVFGGKIQQVFNLKAALRSAGICNTFSGTVCSLKECLSIKSHTKRVFLVFDTPVKTQWSILA